MEERTLRRGISASKETGKMKYEKRRTMVGRGFRKEWLSEFSWLEYSTEHSFKGETFFSFNLELLLIFCYIHFEF